MVSQYEYKNSPLSICTIIIVRDYIVKLAVIYCKLNNVISTNVYGNFGLKCMFSTTFIDPDEWLDNSSTNAHHSRSVQPS